MLFMGEEWGARTPWQFFSYFPDEELRDAVREGRTAEFGEHGWDDGSTVPDPSAEATFTDGILTLRVPKAETARVTARLPTTSISARAATAIRRTNVMPLPPV